jgi:hypothetical protein
MNSFVTQLSRIPDPDTRMDRYMEHQGGRTVRSTDMDLMILFGYDPVAADDFLAKWADRHGNDCYVHSRNPTSVQVLGTILPDMENRSIYQKRQQSKSYAIRKTQERREWDDL